MLIPTLQTKYRGPQDLYGSCIITYASNGDFIEDVPYDHSLRSDEMHIHAARQTANNYGGWWISYPAAHPKDDGFIHVCVPDCLLPGVINVLDDAIREHNREEGDGNAPLRVKDRLIFGFNDMSSAQYIWSAA